MSNLPRDSWGYYRDTKTAKLAGRIADMKRDVYAAFPRWLRWIPWLLLEHGDALRTAFLVLGILIVVAAQIALGYVVGGWLLGRMG